MPTGLPCFIEECPDYSVRDGRMQISIGTFRLVMPIHVFLEGCLRGKGAIAEWQVRKIGGVMPFPARPTLMVEKLGGS